MELAVPSFVFTPGRNFRERTASGPLDDQMANLKIKIDRGPAGLGAETGRIHVGSSTRLIVLRRVLRLSCPYPLDKAPRNCSLPFGSAFRRDWNTTGRMARLQRPYFRRRAKPFNSQPVSKSCAIQAYRLWMEYPSRHLDERESGIDILST